jgi:hypothetical protein
MGALKPLCNIFFLSFIFNLLFSSFYSYIKIANQFYLLNPKKKESIDLNLKNGAVSKSQMSREIKNMKS